MQASTITRLTELSARVDSAVTELASRRPEEESSTLGKTAAGAAVIGAGVTGAAALRGRSWQKRVVGAPVNTVAGIGGALKTGFRLNNESVARGVAGAGAALANAGKKVNQAGRDGLAASLRAGRRTGVGRRIMAR